MRNLDALVKTATLNQEAFKDFPKKKYFSRVATDEGLYLTYATIFRDNTWQQVLWKVATYIPDSQKIRRRRFYAPDKSGRVLNLHTWALLKNLNFRSLKRLYLQEGLTLDQALMFAQPGYELEDFPFYSLNIPQKEV